MTSRPSQPADTTQMSATDVSSRRAASPHQSMFLRMLLRAAMLRRGRATSALLATIVAAAVVSPQGKSFDLSFQGHTAHVRPAGTLETGAAEDSRIYMSLSDFVSWTDVQPSTSEVAATGSAEEVTTAIQRLARSLPAAEVRPVRQILEGEARVLNKTRATL